MKKGCLLFLFAMGAAVSNAQNNTPEVHSPAETFAARKGVIMEKRFDEVGKVGNLNVQIEYLSDLNTSDKLQCIRFDIQANNTSHSALLDTNDVNELISFMKYLSTNVTNRPAVDPNTEISFTTQYDFQIGCFWQGSNGWVLFLRTDSQAPSTEADINQGDINSVLRIFRLAKAQIQRQ